MQYNTMVVYPSVTGNPMWLCNCTNLQFTDIYDPEEEETWIIMDYCEPGSIRDVIETINMPLSEEQAAYVCLAALKGLVLLHNSKSMQLSTPLLKC